jgi:hypothetical protein
MKKSISGAILFILLATACGKVPTDLPDRPVERITRDFESGNLVGFHYLVVDTNFNTQIVSAPVRRGNYALKNTLRPDDYIFNGYRTELSLYNCARYKTDVFYGFSLMIDTAYSDNQFNLLCQWQDLPYYIQGEAWEPTPVLHGSSPPMALVYADGELVTVMNENPNSNNATFQISEPLPVSKGQWIDVVFHCFWSDDNEGFVEAWINGTPIISGTGNRHYGPNIFSRTGNYFKFGQYRGSEPTVNSNIVYFDEVRVGTSYNEVMP